MKVLKIKYLEDWKNWRRGVQPFLDDLTTWGYKWVEVAKDKLIKIFMGDSIVYATMKDFTEDPSWKGTCFNSAKRIGIEGNNLLGIKIKLNLSEPTEREKIRLNMLEDVLMRASHLYEPDFAYEVE